MLELLMVQEVVGGVEDDLRVISLPYTSMAIHRDERL